MPNNGLDGFNNLIICAKGQKWSSNYSRSGGKTQSVHRTTPWLETISEASSKLSVLYLFGSLQTGLILGVITGQSICLLIWSTNCLEIMQWSESFITLPLMPTVSETLSRFHNPLSPGSNCTRKWNPILHSAVVQTSWCHWTHARRTPHSGGCTW